jgi:hypothetical protein
MRRERNKSQRRLQERQTEERGAYLLLSPEEVRTQHAPRAHKERERFKSKTKTKTQRKYRNTISSSSSSHLSFSSFI